MDSNKDKVLIAGPWVSEFGWELMRWQGHIRHLSKSYGATLVLGQEGHSYLYKDFADDFIGHSIEVDSKDRWTAKVGGEPLNFSPIKAIDLWVKSRNFDSYDYIKPSSSVCASSNLEQEFFKYGNSENKKNKIIFHARKSIQNTHGPDRDWHYNNWLSLLGGLRGDLDHDFEFVSIGSKEAAIHIEDTKDQRGIPLEELADLLGSSLLLLGPSSGPHHFAALCGCPSLVWTDNIVWNLGSQKGNNWARYHYHWNPFETSIHVLDKCNWQPTPNEVLIPAINMIAKPKEK